MLRKYLGITLLLIAAWHNTAAGQVPIIHPNPGGGGGTGSSVVTDNVTLTGNGASAANPLAATSNGLTVGIGGTAANKCGGDKVCNVVNYGAVGNQSTDSTAAIQRAYNDAAAIALGGASVYLPAGRYLTTFPIISYANTVTQSFIPVWGAGLSASTILASNGNFPAFMAIPAPNYITDLGTLSNPPLVGATGHALTFNTGHRYFLVLPEVPILSTSTANAAFPLNGLSALTIQFFVQTPNVAGGTQILASSGSPNQALGLYMNVGGSGTCQAKLTTTGGSPALSANPTGGAMPANTTYWMALSYTGSNVYLYCAVPGTGSVSPIASSALTGTIKQDAREGFFLGGQAASMPPNDISASFAFVGQISSLDIESNAVYTGAAVTAPNAAFVGGSHTMYLNNFNTITPNDHSNGSTHVQVPVVSVDYLNGGAQSNSWQTIWNPQWTYGKNYFQMHDMGIQSGTIPLFWAGTPSSVLSNILIIGGTYIGLESYNNTYNSHVTNLNVSASGGGFSALGISWGGSDWVGIQANNGDFPISCAGTGCGTLLHPIEVGNGNFLSGILTQASTSTFSTTRIFDNESDVEAGGNGNGIEIDGGNSGNVELYGGSFAQQGTGVPVLIDGAAPHLKMFGGKLYPNNASSPIISFSDNTQTNSVVLDGTELFGTLGAQYSVVANSSANSILQYVAPPSKFASLLATPQNGMRLFCPDCTVGATCGGSGTGAWADGINGAWVCVN